MCFFTQVLLFICAIISIRCNDCNISSSSGVTDSVIHSQREIMKSNPKKFLKHLQENLQKIRKIYEFGKLPGNETINYYLFTTKNPDTPYSFTNTNASLKNSYYDSKYPLAVVIHGFQNKLDLKKGVLFELKNALLKQHASPNVLYVDYTAINQGPFIVAIKKSFIVARELANVLSFLRDEVGTPFYRMHLIAASLGAHVAGNAGQLLHGRIRRISALDPAGDVFNYFPEDLKLDRNDAIFVDAIHTADNATFPKGLGHYNPVGHLDFYPNGGLYQPGCENVPAHPLMSAELKEALHTVCMHIKAVKYYTESVCVKTCTSIGIMCKDYDKFENGFCKKFNSMKALMGHSAVKPLQDLPKDAKFFLNMNVNSPFCKNE